MSTDISTWEPDPANWEPYRGNNFEMMPRATVRMGGGVSFKRHLGKPLSQTLWEDLLYRLHINGLCVYGDNDPQWTIGWAAGHCCITLDQDNNVWDINFHPY